jgi:hypothetical protein
MSGGVLLLPRICLHDVERERSNEDWLYPAEDRYHCGAVVNALMNHRIARNTGNVPSFRRRAVLHEVSRTEGRMGYN